MNDFKEDEWVRVMDSDVVGMVNSFNITPSPWVAITTEQGQEFVVPQSVVVKSDAPVVERAASTILDLLCEFDPTWRQVDTLDLRRRIVRAAREHG